MYCTLVLRSIYYSNWLISDFQTDNLHSAFAILYLQKLWCLSTSTERKSYRISYCRTGWLALFETTGRFTPNVPLSGRVIMYNLVNISIQIPGNKPTPNETWGGGMTEAFDSIWLTPDPAKIVKANSSGDQGSLPRMMASKSRRRSGDKVQKRGYCGSLYYTRAVLLGAYPTSKSDTIGERTYV